MAIHLLPLIVPAVASGFLPIFKFSFLLWPFNLALPLLRHLPHVCIAVRNGSAHYADQLRRYLAGRRGTRSYQQYYHVRGGGVRRSQQDVVGFTMIALIDISY